MAASASHATLPLKCCPTSANPVPMVLHNHCQNNTVVVLKTMRMLMAPRIFSLTIAHHRKDMGFPSHTSLAQKKKGKATELFEYLVPTTFTRWNQRFLVAPFATILLLCDWVYKSSCEEVSTYQGQSRRRIPPTAQGCVLLSLDCATRLPHGFPGANLNEGNVVGEEAVYLQIAVWRKYRPEFHQCQCAGNNGKQGLVGINQIWGAAGITHK